jgi:hypothetical protein
MSHYRVIAQSSLQKEVSLVHKEAGHHQKVGYGKWGLPIPPEPAELEPEDGMICPELPFIAG